MFSIYSTKVNSHSTKKWLFALIFSLCFATNILAHPMPNSIVQIAIQHNKIVLQLKLPISEFELAFDKELNSNVEQLLKENYTQLSNYLDAHIKLIDEKKSSWKKSIVAITTDSTKSELNGTYNEILLRIEKSSFAKKSLPPIEYIAVGRQCMTNPNHIVFFSI